MVKDAVFRHNLDSAKIYTYLNFGAIFAACGGPAKMAQKIKMSLDLGRNQFIPKNGIFSLPSQTFAKPNKLSMKALAGWIYVLVDSIFRIETVLEWVFQQVIHRRSYVLLSKHVDGMEKWVNESKRSVEGAYLMCEKGGSHIRVLPSP